MTRTAVKWSLWPAIKSTAARSVYASAAVLCMNKAVGGMWTANWMNTRAPDVTLPSDLPKRFVAFHEHHPEPSHDQPAPDRRVSGAPHRQTWSYFDDPQHGVECGVWACETGMWRIRFAPDKLEFFSVIEGHVRLHDADGEHLENIPADLMAAECAAMGIKLAV